MAGRITGITGEINGSTTGLQDVGCFKIVVLADIDLGICVPFFYSSLCLLNQSIKLIDCNASSCQKKRAEPII